jgi:menaquinone-dependent protoporphyrinogen oxidase
MKTLVAYASKHGSTKEIAERIADVLEREGLSVDLREADEVTVLTDYDRVVLGSAVYIARWRPSARRFLKRFMGELSLRDVWFFSSGPVGVDPKAWAERWTVPKLVNTLGPRIGIKQHKVFAGRNAHDATDDYRDWDEIEAWAVKIAESVRQPVPA